MKDLEVKSRILWSWDVDIRITIMFIGLVLRYNLVNSIYALQVWIWLYSLWTQIYTALGWNPLCVMDTCRIRMCQDMRVKLFMNGMEKWDRKQYYIKAFYMAIMKLRNIYNKQVAYKLDSMWFIYLLMYKCI